MGAGSGKDKSDSIYRSKLIELADSQDVTVTRPGWNVRAQRIGPQRDYRAMRKSNPVDRLLPRTVDWILALPPRVRPHILADKYARIANQLCVVWNDPPACRRYFDDLASDRRGGRQGFPPWLTQELGALREYFDRLHPEG